MIKRIFDVIFSIISLLVFSLVLILIAIIIKIDSKGPVFYIQDRVGRYNVDFKIFKFRTMYEESDKLGDLTLGDEDARVTKIGYFLRKYKLDELPQLINVLIGDMSFVGPRPEIRKYVNYYSIDDMQILDIKPGVTGYASLKYINEAEILEKSGNPEKVYIEEIMPDKIRINKIYIKNNSIIIDFKIIIRTGYKMLIQLLFQKK